MKIAIAFLIGFIIGGILFDYFKVEGADFDSSTVEVLEIQAMYDFVVVKDTVVSSTHHYIPQHRFWYIKGIDGNDYISEKQPIILKSFKEWE